MWRRSEDARRLLGGSMAGGVGLFTHSFADATTSDERAQCLVEPWRPPWVSWGLTPRSDVTL